MGMILIRNAKNCESIIGLSSPIVCCVIWKKIQPLLAAAQKLCNPREIGGRKIS